MTPFDVVHLLMWPESYEYPTSLLLYIRWTYYFWDIARSYCFWMLYKHPATYIPSKQSRSICFISTLVLSQPVSSSDIIIACIFACQLQNTNMPFYRKPKLIGGGQTWTATDHFLLLLFRASAMRMDTKEARTVDAKQERERVGDRVWQRALAGLEAEMTGLTADTPRFADIA